MKKLTKRQRRYLGECSDGLHNGAASIKRVPPEVVCGHVASVPDCRYCRAGVMVSIADQLLTDAYTVLDDAIRRHDKGTG